MPSHVTAPVRAPSSRLAEPMARTITARTTIVIAEATMVMTYILGSAWAGGGWPRYTAAHQSYSLPPLPSTIWLPDPDPRSATLSSILGRCPSRILETERKLVHDLA